MGPLLVKNFPTNGYLINFTAFDIEKMLDELTNLLVLVGLKNEEASPYTELIEGIIDKIRYEVEVGKHLYEVDVFGGKNQGLVLAEIELKSEDEKFEKPHWLGMEVTGDERFYNAYLSINPFKSW